MNNKMFKSAVLSTLAMTVSSWSTVVSSETLDTTQWNSVLEQANGQTVYFHAWGGSQEINRYLQWQVKN